MAARNFGLVHKRNVLVVGNVGSGKSTVINKIINEDPGLTTEFSLSRITTGTEQVAGEFKFDSTTKYSVNVIDTIGLVDPEGVSSKQMADIQIIKDIKRTVSNTFNEGISIIFIVLNIQRLRSEEKKLFEVLKSNFDSGFWKICTLIFTHCELLSDATIKLRLDEIKKKYLPLLPAAHFEWNDTRIKTVGFPKESEIAEEYRAAIRDKMDKDAYILRNAIKEADKLEPLFNIWRQRR